jgi:hypothetical protein
VRAAAQSGPRRPPGPRVARSPDQRGPGGAPRHARPHPDPHAPAPGRSRSHPPCAPVGRAASMERSSRPALHMPRMQSRRCHRRRTRQPPDRPLVPFRPMTVVGWPVTGIQEDSSVRARRDSAGSRSATTAEYASGACCGAVCPRASAAPAVVAQAKLDSNPQPADDDRCHPQRLDRRSGCPQDQHQQRDRRRQLDMGASVNHDRFDSIHNIPRFHAMMIASIN